MDNKQDKQFYWEVKDFLNRKPSNTEKKAKPESLKESIQKMLVSQNKLHSPKVLTEESNKEMASELSCFSENLIKNVNSLLSMNEEAVKNGTPECRAFTPNIVENMFNLKKNLNEALLDPSIASKPGRKNNPLTPNKQQPFLNSATSNNATFMRGFGPRPNLSAFQTLPSYAQTPPPGNFTPAPVNFIGPQSSMPAAVLQDDEPSLLKDLRRARANTVPSYNPDDPGSLEAVRSARNYRNQAIADANIELRGKLDDLRGQLRQARERGDIDVQKDLTSRIRKMNDEMNPGTPQMGNSTQASVGARYAERPPLVKPKQDEIPISSEEETLDYLRKKYPNIELQTTAQILAGPAVGRRQLRNEVPR